MIPGNRHGIRLAGWMVADTRWKRRSLAANANEARNLPLNGRRCFIGGTARGRDSGNRRSLPTATTRRQAALPLWPLCITGFVVQGYRGHKNAGRKEMEFF